MKLQENIYTGENNNKINKRKYKKHSMSPFVSLDAGNVEYNVNMFNRAMGNGVSAEGSETSTALGEAIDTPTYTFSYKGPVYRFERVYTVLKEPIYTTASTAKQAANMIKGKLKNKFGFDYKAKLDIDEDNITLVDVPDNEYQIFNNENKQEAEYDDLDLVGTMYGKDIYYINGKYIVDDMEFVSIGEIEDYLEA